MTICRHLLDIHYAPPPSIDDKQQHKVRGSPKTVSTKKSDVRMNFHPHIVSLCFTNFGPQAMTIGSNDHLRLGGFSQNSVALIVSFISTRLSYSLTGCPTLSCLGFWFSRSLLPLCGFPHGVIIQFCCTSLSVHLKLQKNKCPYTKTAYGHLYSLVEYRCTTP